MIYKRIISGVNKKERSCGGFRDEQMILMMVMIPVYK